jgi:hypothetical protein
MTLYAATRITNKNSWTERITKGNPTPPLFHGKLEIPEELRDELITDFHTMPAIGHQGIFKTTNRIRQYFDYADLKKRTTDIIKKCDLCNKAKAARHKQYGELQPIPPPNRA